MVHCVIIRIRGRSTFRNSQTLCRNKVKMYQKKIYIEKKGKLSNQIIHMQFRVKFHVSILKIIAEFVSNSSAAAASLFFFSCFSKVFIMSLASFLNDFLSFPHNFFFPANSLKFNSECRNSKRVRKRRFQKSAHTRLAI